jgi:hypothetical protein
LRQRKPSVAVLGGRVHAVDGEMRNPCVGGSIPSLGTTEK